MARLNDIDVQHEIGRRCAKRNHAGMDLFLNVMHVTAKEGLQSVAAHPHGVLRWIGVVLVVGGVNRHLDVLNGCHRFRLNHVQNDVTRVSRFRSVIPANIVGGVAAGFVGVKFGGHWLCLGRRGLSSHQGGKREKTKGGKDAESWHVRTPLRSFNDSEWTEQATTIAGWEGEKPDNSGVRSAGQCGKMHYKKLVSLAKESSSLRFPAARLFDSLINRHR